MDPWATQLGEPAPARWLFVANGNRDRFYRAGSVIAIDLEAFWDAWYEPEIQGAWPYCEHDEDGDEASAHEGRCVQPPGARVDARHPCRRLASMPQVVECDERPFVRSDVHIGNFSTVLDYSWECLQGGPCEPCADPCAEDCLSYPRLWLPVRGDPSVAYIDARPKREDGACTIELRCGQGDDEADAHACAEERYLRYVRNDPDLVQLGREPFNIVVPKDDQHRLAYVSHQSSTRLSVIALDGIAGDSRPAIVDEAALFTVPANAGVPGGYGIAVRPCFGPGQGPDPADAEDNVPGLTQDCSRPLVYGAYRYTVGNIGLPSLRMTNFTVSGIDEDELASNQYCASPEDLGKPGAVVCDPIVRGASTFDPGGLAPASGGYSTGLGEIAFADPRGDTLLAVQSQPGALLRINTSLDARAEPRNISGGPPVELCGDASAMALLDDGQERLAFVSCFAAAQIFVIDLVAFRVIEVITAGTGPHELVVDPGRKVLYAANTLDATISVVDLARERPTRFTEIARIGLQEPFGR